MNPLDYSYERCFWEKGRIPAGVDEAGRGPIAGPVVSAAVILDSSFIIDGINDSKKLSVKKRDELYASVMKNALSVSTGIVQPEEIDRINILQAALKSMAIAVDGLTVKPDYLFVDGNQRISSEIEQETIVRGDSICPSIAAASIVAKVTRDRIMQQIDDLYPVYRFSKHKGYPTRDHIEAVRKYGPCPVHRRSFKGVSV